MTNKLSKHKLCRLNNSVILQCYFTYRIFLSAFSLLCYPDSQIQHRLCLSQHFNPHWPFTIINLKRRGMFCTLQLEDHSFFLLTHLLKKLFYQTATIIFLLIINIFSKCRGHIHISCHICSQWMDWSQGWPWQPESWVIQQHATQGEACLCVTRPPIRSFAIAFCSQVLLAQPRIQDCSVPPVWPILPLRIGEIRQKSCGPAHRSHPEHWVNITGSQSHGIWVHSSKRWITHNNKWKFLSERRNKIKF